MTSTLPYYVEYKHMSLLALQNNLFHQKERLEFVRSLEKLKCLSTESEILARINTLNVLIDAKKERLANMHNTIEALEINR